ncbi:MAG: hypothetical protein IKK37_06365 [Clostridia bacterium]|nr:hypothetical protein [Clostridia bacterium]
MKKTYVVPESKLIAINIKESIAVASGGISEIAGSAIIKFTHEVDGCRGYYTGVMSAPVKNTTTSFIDFYNELRTYGMEPYFNCLSYNMG